MSLTRRDLIFHASAIAALAAGRPLPAFAAGTDGRIKWQNWSGGQQCLPEARLAPANAAEVAKLIADSPRPIRPVGTGHSFTALVPTDGTVLSLDRLNGVLDIDSETLEATVGAGSKLGDLGPALEEHGQALINMPDINRQTLAGSISTSTHGTGAEFGSLSTFVTGLELVNGTAETLWCDTATNPDLFQAARVSLGALGVVTKVRLQNRTPHRINRRTWVMPFEEMMAEADAFAAANRNFEFYYIPFSSMCFGISHNETDEPVSPRTSNDDDDGVMTLKTLADYLGWAPSIREYFIRSALEDLPDDVFVDTSWKIYPSERGVRFNEMEYHLPRENALAALREIREHVEGNNLDLFFPWEFRYVKADDIWLSPFQGRDCCSIAVHRFYEEDYRPLFAAVEPILRKHGGRPHWGKLHTLKAQDFAGLYPHWNDFLEVRQAMDPDGVFLNAHLKEVFGLG
ncbi:MAG: D-arabinono-1,4-lactone oxidase [Parvibaculaceae bacterium]